VVSDSHTAVCPPASYRCATVRVQTVSKGAASFPPARAAFSVCPSLFMKHCRRFVAMVGTRPEENRQSVVVRRW